MLPLKCLWRQMDAAGIRDSNVDHAVSHLGKAVGIASLLRGTTHHAARSLSLRLSLPATGCITQHERCPHRRRSYLPVDLMAREGVSQEALYRGEAPPGALSNIVYDIASVAKVLSVQSRESGHRHKP